MSTGRAASSVKLLTIAQAAKAVGVPVSTLRYYEREGIIGPSRHKGSGYRLYDDDTVRRVRLVRAAQSIGLALRDVKALIDMDAKRSQPQVRAMLEARLKELDEKLNELGRVRDALSRALEQCRCSGPGGTCGVLVSLGIEASALPGESKNGTQAQGGGGGGRGPRRRGRVR